ncbi:hypothetical protein [Pseudoalteromonas luteoviolacea]|uniref:Uncharacterized protein n=1 Tax=Pseudoalteromonas luteoviolacea S4054 TaxID=1129367 RepID=A0A0F6AD98_9GAMM|nr:hypothetical protein [Pseudoalteromonas luteoviolacea]AOT08265.1 hypothetical protein S4054249_10615 [Pseudoalteromonas luteoviolacea]AOT13181.1 hypothetical protein S40542_10590 [Pseudoalteromonas luteoviolacea]AOT18093.1 hypothetical protein S4054_10585 [Pseudoalteromonas luteoviolacea]KKE84197.1 hypothetical protein N479_09875 [Pseudoalteromonas luteoviolacea S4054]KZN76198.1 hypothetical protein N481_07540 [Pseudoalteromonas luteoviolacea S4047-1]
MTWFNSTNANATNGSNIIKINDNQSVANIRTSDALVLGAFAPVEISKAYVTTHGTFVELIKPWPNATQSQVPCVVLPTSGDFNTAVSALNNASKIVNDNYKAMLDWQTKTGSVQFNDLDENIQTVKTLRQMQSEIDAVNPHAWAMRKVEFEALRQLNLEKYAASGFVSFGSHYHSPPFYNKTNEGLWTDLTLPNILVSGPSDYGISHGKSNSKAPVIHIAGVITKIANLSSANAEQAIFKFAEAEHGARTYDTATGVSVTHSSQTIAFASETETNKVIANRADVWGFESFLREINDEDPFVYKHGLIQSHAPDINSVATADDMVRPASYFAWFKGDETSRGRGVNWQAASESQRIRIANDPENNIYFDDATSKFYQWCVRGRSFSGIGNGDWECLDVANYNGFIGFRSSKSMITAQGSNSDSGAAFTNNNVGLYAAELFDSFHDKSPMIRGVYSAFDNTNSFSECYFIVCGTINRLNSGVYHISLNPFGAALAADGKTFSETGVSLTTTADCFDTQKILSGSGSIASNKSGRPDGRFYDAIYASGQGGVCRDIRYSANGVSLKDFAAADLSVKAGEYHGAEKMRLTAFSKIIEIISPDSNYTLFRIDREHPFYNGAQKDGGLGDGTKPFGHAQSLFIYNVADKVIERTTSYDACFANNYGTTYDSKTVGRCNGGYQPRVGDIVLSMRGIESLNTLDISSLHTSTALDISVAGEYLHIDVMGIPADIMQFSGLKGGWIGSWISDLSISRKQLSKPVIGNVNNIQIIFSNGTTWSAGSQGYDFNTNTTDDWDPKNIALLCYNTKASSVANANYTTELYGGGFAVNNMTMGASPHSNFGALLCHDLIGKRPNLDGDDIYHTETLTSFTMRPELGCLWGSIKHNPVSTSGVNGSTGCKIVPVFSVENSQAFINYAYRELHHNGADWGDDGQINLVNGQSTVIDSNGKTVKVGTAQIKEALGWVK